MPMGGRGTKKKVATKPVYSDARQGRIEAPQIERTIANRPRLPVGDMGSQQMEDPIAFWQRTLAEQGAMQNYPKDGGGGGSRGRGGGGYGGGGGRGGGGGGAAGPNWAAALAAIAGPYDQATRLAQDNATGARRRVESENALLNTSIQGSNAQTQSAIGQRAQVLQQILAEAQQRQQQFQQIGRRDLAGQGLAGTGYDAVANIEGQRLGSLGMSQRQLGGDLDTLARDQMAQRSAYSAQSRADAMLGVQDAESKMIQQIALQRAQEEAKLRAEAAMAGVKL